MDEIVKDFLIESNENLDRLDQELVKLETNPSSKELLASIFRTIHTIKGSCGFLGFARLEKLTHAGENLLSRLRDSKLSLTEEITSGLLAMVDAVRKMLSAIQSSGENGNEEHAPLIAHLGRLQQPQATGPATLPAALPATLPATLSTTLASADASQALLPRPPSAPVETGGSTPIQKPSPDVPLKIEESPTERAQELS